VGGVSDADAALLALQLGAGMPPSGSETPPTSYVLHQQTAVLMSASQPSGGKSLDHGSLSGELDEPGTGKGSHEVDLLRIERAVREILFAVGEDPDREGLRETPARVARMYRELFSGLHTDPRIHLQKFFTEKYDEMVLVKDISFNSMCEHHMLPFIGKAHIGYVPNGKVVGLSKLARVVEEISHRPQVQERMTEQIANLLVEELGVKGVAVVIEAAHSCMSIRGVRKPDSLCVTSAMKGLFRSNLSSRSEVMNLIYGGR
jgi:GTP cyclohydrolase I